VIIKRCKKNKSHVWRVKVNLFVDIPLRLVHRMAKTRIRSKDVQVDGADWPQMLVYCATCGVMPFERGVHP